jgi:sterol carrier protein 2
MDMAGYGMTVLATKASLDEAGATPKDIKVRELHDCFSTNQLISLEAMGFVRRAKHI